MLKGGKKKIQKCIAKKIKVQIITGSYLTLLFFSPHMSCQNLRSASTKHQRRYWIKNNAEELQLSAHQNARTQQQTQKTKCLATSLSQSDESSTTFQNQPQALLSVQPQTATQKRKT